MLITERDASERGWPSVYATINKENSLPLASEVTAEAARAASAFTALTTSPSPITEVNSFESSTTGGCDGFSGVDFSHAHPLSADETKPKMYQ
ncbi:hypothetical protein L1987_62889 [Smallanthus sonchifolius]|uniref:Uncharacterized protein n=1 Tax=Smallanthus sonchifolius TaxID=185202 RepID=A0ACB9CBU3_9ASTR|nr:hypothetical protein L1987_62889 [Smallanthus sonchifolius]